MNFYERLRPTRRNRPSGSVLHLCVVRLGLGKRSLRQCITLRLPPIYILRDRVGCRDPGSDYFDELKSKRAAQQLQRRPSAAALSLSDRERVDIHITVGRASRAIPCHPDR